MISVEFELSGDASALSIRAQALLKLSEVERASLGVVVNNCVTDLMYGISCPADIWIDTSTRLMDLSQLPASLKRGFEAASAASEHSDWKNRRDRMGSAIFMGSRLLSIGFNHCLKAKPSNRFYKETSTGIIEYLKPFHAEQSSLVKIRHRQYKNNKLSMFVFRSDAEGRPAASFPCELCQKELANSNITIVHFIAPGGFYGKWILNGKSN